LPKLLCHIALALVAVSGDVMAAEVSTDADEARVIVKYRQTATPAGQTNMQRHQVMGKRLNMTFTTGIEPAPRQQVIRARGMSHEQLAERLASDPDVEWAVPDRVKHAHSLPNDMTLGGRDQWYLRPSGYVYKAQSPAVAAINAQAAWDLAGGGTGVVVAVLDTGVRYDHPDLAGQLLPGYDFISDVGTSVDGNGRDADASDTGDGWYGSPSSWHGTRTAGLIAAVTNNGMGIAGVAWGAKVLPVRVLGRDGGNDSDIIAGARWAAGLSVTGVPNNPHPAKVLNLSLGGTSTCSLPWQEAIAEIVAHGSLVVVSAGNESSAVDEPANCPGALAVVGVRHVGTKVGYSSFGQEAGIAAPAGNCVTMNDGDECLFSIDTTVNLGDILPGVNGYTTRINPDANVGTSFSSPMAAGVAALMLAVNPSLTPMQLLDRIKRSARPFPVDVSLPFCEDNMPLSTDNEGQCNCTPTTCGAGLLDAEAAIQWAQQPSSMALPPVVAINVQSSGQTGASITLDGQGSFAAPGSTVTTWLWSYTAGPQKTSPWTSNRATTAFTPLHPGTYIFKLTATASNGKSAHTFQSFQVAAAPGYVSTLPTLEYPLVLESGWNLLGNSLGKKLSVASLYGNPNVVVSVWKWRPDQSLWQFYAPSMDTATLQTYATDKGYGVLSDIDPGEGYWVKAKLKQTLSPQKGTPVASTKEQLVPRWNLMATSTDVLPKAFNTAMGITPTTLWAWNSALSKWYYYAPSLDLNGTLLKTIEGYGYLDFVLSQKTLGQGTGFWVNMP
jgi:serine protease